MALPVSILSIGSLSPLGHTPEKVWRNYLSDRHFITSHKIGGDYVPVSALSADEAEIVNSIRASDSRYKNLDASVLYAIAASRSAVKRAGWAPGDTFGVNIGSSRGATQLFENHYDDFSKLGKVSPQASPATTLGNISSWVAADLATAGPEISHSITCSTALHAVLNAVAWLGSGMADKFLAGGSEAPLTPFTIAQMKAMKIYSQSPGEYPCRALDMAKKENTMILGEGAAVACLEAGSKHNALAVIEGVGYATEVLTHGASITPEGDGLKRAMLMALKNTDVGEVDAIVMHVPGTVKGDLSEYKAIQSIFCEKLPLLTGNKWKIGHTFGTSGLLSLEMAVMMLQNNKFIPVPYLETPANQKSLRKILVNAVGFGGNAVSILVSR